MLEIENLSVSYDHVQAVRDVSFRVEEGAVATLLGPNGAGKTTTLNAISGVVPADGGSIMLEGRDITGVPAYKRVEAGVVQVPEGRLMLSNMSVRENLEMGGYRRPRAEIAADVSRMEERFPVLGERRNTPAGALSGGEQQMLAIARGLMAHPKVLLLDEPSLGLAPKLVQQVFDIVGELRDDGQTILLVEQNSRKALTVSSYNYVLESGEVVLEGTSEQLREDPAMVRAYFGGAI